MKENTRAIIWWVILSLILYFCYNINYKVSYVYNNFSWVICEENEKETCEEKK